MTLQFVNLNFVNNKTTCYCSESRLISRYLNRGCWGGVVLPVSWEQLPQFAYVTKRDFSATAEQKELT